MMNVDPIRVEYGFHIAVKDSKVTVVGNGIFIPIGFGDPRLKELKEFLTRVYKTPDDIVPESWIITPPTWEEIEKRIQTLSGK